MPADRTLKARLMAMMFLQFFIGGAWNATGGNYMKARGMTDVIYLASAGAATRAEWQLFWLVPLVFAAIVTAVFVAGFREEPPPGSAAVVLQ